MSTPHAAGRALAAAALVLSIACGNGSGGPAPAATCRDAPEGFSAVADRQVALGHVAGAAVAGCSGPLADVAWTQTGGPAAVDLVAADTQAIGFEPPAAGTYAFRVDFRDGAGMARSAAVTVDVAAAGSGSRVTARGDQAVRMGGHASLRAWPALAPGDAVAALEWTQLEGPPVTLDASDPRSILFTAPAVERDTLLRFRVTLRTALGATDADEALVVVERAPAPAEASTAPFAGLHVSRVHPYVRAGPYAAVLASCVYDASLDASTLCPLSRLPALAQETRGAVPTVAQVMDRVLVSHDWLGGAFERFLATQDPHDDLKRLLEGVTAVVIGAHVRPSMYYAVTGAIYLDANALWLRPEERDTIDETPDYRSSFGRDLQYSAPWRYVVGDAYARRYFAPDARVARDLAYLRYELSDVLYHELAHASDFLPPSARGSLDPARSFWDNVARVRAAGGLVSDAVTATFPLESQPMKGLAQVAFRGVQATSAQRAYGAADVGGFFAADRATDDYGYVDPREDLAMLFEELMMAHRGIARRDLAFTNAVREGMTGDDLVVAWGERGRVGDAAVRPRVRLAVQAIAPWIDPAAVDALDPPVPLRAGASWIANLAPAPAGNALRGGAAGPAPAPHDLRLDLEAMARRSRAR